SFLVHSPTFREPNNLAGLSFVTRERRLGSGASPATQLAFDPLLVLHYLLEILVGRVHGRPRKVRERSCGGGREIGKENCYRQAIVFPDRIQLARPEEASHGGELRCGGQETSDWSSKRLLDPLRGIRCRRTGESRHGHTTRAGVK